MQVIPNPAQHKSVQVLSDDPVQPAMALLKLAQIVHSRFIGRKVQTPPLLCLFLDNNINIPWWSAEKYSFLLSSFWISSPTRTNIDSRSFIPSDRFQRFLEFIFCCEIPTPGCFSRFKVMKVRAEISGKKKILLIVTKFPIDVFVRSKVYLSADMVDQKHTGVFLQEILWPYSLPLQTFFFIYL